MRLGLILSLTLLAFAHLPLRATPLDLSAYAMPDGTLPDLCLIDAEEEHSAHNTHCPACHSAAVIPVPSPSIAAVWTQLPEALLPQTAAQIILPPRASAPPEARAPPALPV